MTDWSCNAQKKEKKSDEARNTATSYDSHTYTFYNSQHKVIFWLENAFKE